MQDKILIGNSILIVNCDIVIYNKKYIIKIYNKKCERF